VNVGRSCRDGTGEDSVKFFHRAFVAEPRAPREFLLKN
jgi:hypothetical protein